jgi:hypothetical protein
VFRELVNERLQQFPAAPGDFRRQFTIAEARPGKSEIAVKRIDQNLEISLPRLGLGALFRRRCGAREQLEFQAVFLQPFQQGNENPERVIFGRPPDLQQQTRIKRRHVEMKDVMENPFLKTFGISALEGLDFGRHGTRLARVRKSRSIFAVVPRSVASCSRMGNVRVCSK